jgi:Tol biopolymer transport system component
VSGAADVSPDGARLVFTRKLSEAEAVLFTARIDGSDERQLTQADGAFHGSPAWSPDGKSLAYYRDGGKGVSTIEIVRTDGSGRRTLVGAGQNWYPRWSADGRWLLLTSMKPGGAKDDVELFAVRTDGGGELIPLASSPKREAEGSWRPPPRG